MRIQRRSGRVLRDTPARVATAILLTTWASLAAACTGGEADTTRHRVGIRAFQYVPVRLTVAVGDTVVWINEDAVPHTATAGDRGWDTGNIPSRDSGQVVLRSKGEFPYVCAFHPDMGATLIVQ